MAVTIGADSSIPLGIPAADQYLVCAGRPLETGSLLDAGVAALNTIEVGVRMIGGKVHGSLARAGKVKGQTPKIEKQEKKKQKTGMFWMQLCAIF